MLLTRYFYFGEFSRFEQQLRSYASEERHFERGEHLCRPSELLDSVFYIENGMTLLSILHESGDEDAICYWGSGDIVPLVVEEQRLSLESSMLLRAVAETTVLRLSPQAMKQAMLDCPELAVAAVNRYTRYANMLLFSRVTAHHEPPLTRLASFLYSYLRYLPNERNAIELSQGEIASVLGMSRASVARALTALKKEDVVSTSRGKVCVLDVDGLEAHLSRCMR